MAGVNQTGQRNNKRVVHVRMGLKASLLWQSGRLFCCSDYFFAYWTALSSQLLFYNLLVEYLNKQQFVGSWLMEKHESLTISMSGARFSDLLRLRESAFVTEGNFCFPFKLVSERLIECGAISYASETFVESNGSLALPLRETSTVY
ncbi:hypothetical protein M514_04798 [Trichuris suis]|uniref:Uncharacterized protein n=1 Tax=Trichuris suis TaxID=68888 RepID=A0A085MAL0_9BILA|nr:hypothetical protein M513_04798 [Trichuris suis]KFD73190.1 hypothetical protein M514_04798 [Trichuris suis]